MNNGEYLQFPNQFLGNSNGCFNSQSGTFTALVSGRYLFRLYLQVYNAYPNDYNISMKLNGSSKHYFYGTGSADRSQDSRFYEAELELVENDRVQFYISYAANGLKYNMYSYLEGRI